MAKKENKTKKETKHFFKDFKAEIKKVIWPTPKQLVNSTIAIITMVLVVAVIVFVLDVAFEAFNKHALTNLQKAVQSSVSTETTDNNEEQASDNSSEESTTEESGEETATDGSSEEVTTEENTTTEQTENPEDVQANE